MSASMLADVLSEFGTRSFLKPGKGIMYMRPLQDVRLLGSVASTGH